MVAMGEQNNTLQTKEKSSIFPQDYNQKTTISQTSQLQKNVHSEIRYRAYLFWHATAVFVRTETVIGREPPMQVLL